MESVKVGAARPLLRAGIVASSLALIAMVLSPRPAMAATVIGSPTGDTVCAGQFDTVQITSTVSYAVPTGGGTITSWSTLADAGNAGPVGLEVWRPTAALYTYQLVGLSPLVTLTPSVVNIFTLATPIAVQAGDLLGLRIEGPAMCGLRIAGGTYGYNLGATPGVGAITQFGFSNNFQLDVEATLGAVTPPPPPPPPGCDSSSNSTGDSTGNSKDESGNKSKDDSNKECKGGSKDRAKDATGDSTKGDSTDRSNDTTTVSTRDDSTDRRTNSSTEIAAFRTIDKFTGGERNNP